MKVYVSADIEGVTGVTTFDETQEGKPGYDRAREQMTAEVAAACEGAIAGGATEVWVKDAHNEATNLIAERLPEAVRLIRGWSGHPLSMMQELDGSFAAAVMIGYHARARAGASPLEHTFSGRVGEIRVNGRPFSEFAVAAHSAAYFRVPVAAVSGDEGVCAEAVELCPKVAAVPVKRGAGASTISIHPGAACDRIRQAVKKAMKRDLAAEVTPLPDRFVIDFGFRRHADAYVGSFYPGASLVDPMTVRFQTDDYFEALRAACFILHG